MRTQSILRWLVILGLPGADLVWNLTHLNIGLVDFFGLAAFAHNFAISGVWPATPYFPCGYPLLLAICGLAGNVLVGGYVLSACGMALTLWAIGNLARHWRLAWRDELVLLLLCWLMPVWRVVAGSPSVDALYTGAAAWFIAAAVVLYTSGARSTLIPRWVQTGIVAAPFLALELRYHAVILALPVLAMLLLQRSAKARRLALLGLGAVALAYGINAGGYYLAFQRPLPPVAAVQIATGIELARQVHYPSAEMLWADYAGFAEKVRGAALLSQYPATTVLTHTAKNWVMFIRQPAVLLSAALVMLALVLRRCTVPGGAITFFWMLGYTLALSPAYYTARAALLPCAIGIGLTFTTAHALQRRVGLDYVVTAVITGLLAFGFMAASSFSRADYQTRWLHSEVNRWVTQWMAESDASRAEICTVDSAILMTGRNPWCEPFSASNWGWLDDPAIWTSQRAGLHICGGECRYLLTKEDQTQQIINKLTDYVVIENNNNYLLMQRK